MSGGCGTQTQIGYHSGNFFQILRCLHGSDDKREPRCVEEALGKSEEEYHGFLGHRNTTCRSRSCAEWSGFCANNSGTMGMSAPLLVLVYLPVGVGQG